MQDPAGIFELVELVGNGTYGQVYKVSGTSPSKSADGAALKGHYVARRFKCKVINLQTIIKIYKQVAVPSDMFFLIVDEIRFMG